MITAPTNPVETALLAPPPTHRSRNPGAAAFPKVTPEDRPTTPNAVDTWNTGPGPGQKATAPEPLHRKVARRPADDPNVAIVASSTPAPAAALPPTVPASQPMAAEAAMSTPLPDPQRSNHPTPEPGPLSELPVAAPPAITPMQPAGEPTVDDAAGNPGPPSPAPASTAPARTAAAAATRKAQPGSSASGPAASAQPVTNLLAADPATSGTAPAGQQTQPGQAATASQSPHPKASASLPPTTSRQPAADPEGPDSQPGRQGGGSRGQTGITPAASGLNSPGPQSLPFRLESGALPSEGAAAVPATSAEPAQSAAAITEADPSLALQGPDVTITLDSDQRLDVTIATATRSAADRVEAARADLQRDLSALGAEVEAIRVEVRSERAPDGTGQGNSSQGTGSQGDRQGQSERQGQAMRNRSEQQSGQPEGSATGLANRLHLRIGDNTTAGRVDRYA